MHPVVLLLALVSAPAESSGSSAAPAGAPKEHGPFFAPEAPTEARFSSGPKPGAPPRFSLGQGMFCFVEDAQCRISLLASIDVGIGFNAIGKRGPDLPYAHANFRGGLTVRPLTLIRKKWHPWAVGVVASWSRGTGVLVPTGDTDDMTGEAVVDQTPRTLAHRFALVNQVWLSQKRNAFHLDFTIGLVRSSVLADTKNIYAGTHAELAGGWGGWGSLFVSGDFLYSDTRVVAGFRGHGIATAPAVGLLLLGLLAGGAFQ